MSCPPWSESRRWASHEVPREWVSSMNQLGLLLSSCPTARLGCKASGPSWLEKCGDVILQASPKTDVESPWTCPTSAGRSVWPKALSQKLLSISGVWSPLPSHPPSTRGVGKGAHEFCLGPGNGTQRDEKKANKKHMKIGRVWEGEPCDG